MKRGIWNIKNESVFFTSKIYLTVYVVFTWSTITSTPHPSVSMLTTPYTSSAAISTRIHNISYYDHSIRDWKTAFIVRNKRLKLPIEYDTIPTKMLQWRLRISDWIVAREDKYPHRVLIIIIVADKRATSCTNLMVVNV